MMRLQELGLDFFGHYTGKRFDFGDKLEGGSDFHVIYGPNEAGKTTLMEGYLRLLYGFPGQDPYAFKHSRKNLKVSAALNINGALRHMTRLSTRSANLLDDAGAVLPETAISGALAGLSMEDYRQLLCLDDETIEKGGLEIAQSKGDIGKLLFSAAAGISDLSAVLEQVGSDAGDLFKKGGTKSVFAGLKKDWSETGDKIKADDVTAADYKRLKQALDAARAEEDAERARLDALRAERVRLSHLADALPRAEAIARLSAELEPLAGYPQDVAADPERLNAMARNRALHDDALRRLEGEIAELRAKQEALPSQPERMAMFAQLKDLAGLREKVGSQVSDLPNRRGDEAQMRDAMRRCLADMGLGAVSSFEDIQRYLLDGAALQALQDAYGRLEKQKYRLAEARKEERDANEALDAARLAAEQAGGPMADGPDFAALLERHDAEALMRALQEAKTRLAQFRRDQAEARVRLSLGAQHFDATPQLALSHSEAQALTDDIRKAGEELARAEDEAKAADAKLRLLEARREALMASGAAISDEEASAVRAERDRLWDAHKGALSLETANAFEAAMRQDDAQGEARLARANDIASLRALALELADAKLEVLEKAEAVSAAQATRDGVEARLADAQRSIGVEALLSPARFADWVRLVEMAREADIKEAGERAASEPVFERARALKQALADALGMAGEDTSLQALVSMAEARAEQRKQAALQVKQSREQLAEAEQHFQRRHATAQSLQDECDAATSVWTELLLDTFGEQGQRLAFPQAFAGLQTLREHEAKRYGFAHQIEAMERNEQQFREALAPLKAKMVTELPELEALEGIALHDELARLGQEAAEAAATHHALTARLEEFEAGRADALKAMAEIDAEAQAVARLFDPSIETASLDALRVAVMTAQKADGLRAGIAEKTRDLCAGLGEANLASALARLEDVSREGLEAALGGVDADLDVQQARQAEASAERGRAEAALAAIGEGADVAILNARRQLLELDMETTLLDHLRLKMGQMMADEAIRRYRDRHRSGMMQSAQDAFADLTNGAYNRLMSQTSSKGEFLVAVQAADNASKSAEDMSKGTKFQLYLALRAAAYEQMAANGTVLPFFCDDVFETFDEERTRSACRLMHSIGKTGQAIYLTHHRHVVDLARELYGDGLRVHRLVD